MSEAADISCADVDALRAERDDLELRAEAAEQRLRAVFEVASLLYGSDDEAAWETVQRIRTLAGGYLPPAPVVEQRGYCSTCEQSAVFTPTGVPDEARCGNCGAIGVTV